MRRIAILGAECTGKTQLGLSLAERIGATFVPEALRLFVEEHGRVPRESEMLLVGRAQRGLEEQAIATGARLLVCDTTPLMVALYASHYFERVDPVLDAMSDDVYDLTLLASDDIAWIADGLQRDGEEVRRTVQLKLKKSLEKRSISYAEVSGSPEERIASALSRIKATEH